MSTSLPEFVTRHLDEIAAREGFHAGYTCNEHAGSQLIQGFSSGIRAIELSGQRSDPQTGAPRDAKLALVVKLLPESVERQAMFHSRMVFEREVHFYVTLLPLLQRFQREKGLTPESGFFGYPHCYAAVADAATSEYVIVMRDLRAAGFAIWNKAEPMPFENVKLLFEQLGRMTGISLALQEQRPEEFAAIRETTDIWTVMLKSESVIGLCRPFFEQAVEMIDSAEHKNVLIEIRDNWVDIVRYCLQTTDAFSSLSHGDCWTNNTIFRGGEICLVDWQLSRLVSPALDIANFFASSTDKAMRDQCYDRLLNIFHENVANAARLCGSDPDKLMTIADLHDQMRRFGCFGVIMAPILLQVIVADSSSYGDLDEMAHGLNSDQKQSNVKFANFNAKSLETYRRRMADIIDDAQRYGWL